MGTTTPKKSRNKPSKYRRNNGEFNAHAKKTIVEGVVERLSDGEPRRNIVKWFQEEFAMRDLKVIDQWFAKGEQAFLDSAGYSKPQIRELIVDRNLSILSDKEAKPNDIAKATSSLQKMFHLEDPKPTEDLGREVQLWMRVFDKCDVEKLDAYIEQMHAGTFRVGEISEEVALKLIDD